MAQRHRPFLHRLIASSCDLNARLRKVEQIEPEEALERLRRNQPTLWIDARTPAEQAVSTIPGAVTVDQAIEQLCDSPDNQLPNQDRSDNQARLIIVYCTAGFRSANFVAKLARMKTKAMNLRGGLFGWCEADGPLADPQGQETRAVHTYGRYARFVPDSYQPRP